MGDKKFSRWIKIVLRYANKKGTTDFEREFKQKMRKVLDSIVQNRRIVESEELSYFLEYESLSENAYSLEICDGKLQRGKPKSALHLINEEPHLYTGALLNALKQIDENQISRIKKCQYCRSFFYANDIRRVTRCYSDDCEKAYQRIKKQKQREKDPVKYL